MKNDDWEALESDLKGLEDVSIVNLAFDDLTEQTPLLFAIRKNKEEGVKILLENGCKSYQIYEQLGRNSIHVAAQKANPRIFGLIIDNLEDQGKVNESEKGKLERTPLQILTASTIKKPDDEEIKKCFRKILEVPGINLDKTDINEESPLCLAIDGEKS